MIGYRRNNENSRISKGGFRWILDDMWSALQGEIYQRLALLISVDESECSHCPGYTGCHFGPASTVTHGAQNRHHYCQALVKTEKVRGWSRLMKGWIA